MLLFDRTQHIGLSLIFVWIFIEFRQFVTKNLVCSGLEHVFKRVWFGRTLGQKKVRSKFVEVLTNFDSTVEVGSKFGPTSTNFNSKVEVSRKDVEVMKNRG